MRSTPTTCTAPELAITVAVPVYDNAGSLPALHARLTSTLAETGSAFEIVYVNDASRDASLEVLWRLHASDDRVTVVDLAENAGQSAAVLAALGCARGDVVVTIDADLENHPEDIPALVAAIRNGADLACGARQRRNARPLTRRAPSVIANRLVGRALGSELQDWGCGLNAVSADLVRRLLARSPLPSLPKIEAVLLASRIAEVPVSYSEREHGKSGYTVRRLCGFAAAFLRGFSIAGAVRRLRAAGTPPAIGAWAAWLVLSGGALVVRAWPSGSAARKEPFRIREIRASRAGGPAEPHFAAARRGIDHTTSSRDVGRTLKALIEPD